MTETVAKRTTHAVADMYIVVWAQLKNARFEQSCPPSQAGPSISALPWAEAGPFRV